MNTRISWLMGVLLAVLLTAVSGLLQGRMSQRWGFDQRMAAAVAQLERLPKQLGPWTHETDYELSKTAIELLSCQGYIHRGYRNQLTGDFVKLAIMVGPGSKMSIHVPEICYEANNFSLLQPRSNLTTNVDGQEHSFWQVVFQVNDATEQRLQVIYGWSDGGPWVATDMPRWSLAGAPVLFKMQLSSTPPSGGAQSPEQSRVVVETFLQDMIRSLEATVNERDRPAREARSQQPSLTCIRLARS